MADQLTPTDLDELIANASEVEVLEATSFEGATVRFELHKTDHTITARFRFDFPDGVGSIDAPIDIDPEDVERLYRMARLSVLWQLADARSGHEEEPELPSVAQVVQEEELSPFVVEPLCLENVGRRKVIDTRADYSHRKIDENSTDRNRRTADYGYITGVTVHRSDCVKVQVHVKDEPWHRPRGRSVLTPKTFTNGRFSTWEEILPVIRRGLLHISLCLTCKPLGEYSKAINARTSFGTADQPPVEMPWEFPSLFKGVLGSYQRDQLWRGLMEMTPKRWEALADLIEWAIAEVDSPPVVKIPRSAS